MTRVEKDENGNIRVTSYTYIAGEPHPMEMHGQPWPEHWLDSEQWTRWRSGDRKGFTQEQLDHAELMQTLADLLEERFERRNHE